MKISKRLKAIATLIPDQVKLLDVGCDHALLDIYVVKQKKNVLAVASDIHEGPLESAKQNIRSYGLEDKIETRLGNGLEVMDDTIDTIVISGMGGKNMLGIFKYSMDKLKNIDRIILSPNNDMVIIRTFLLKNGYRLEEEQMMEEKEIIYPILVFRKGKKHYRKIEYFFGPIFLKKKDPVFIKYYQKELTQKEVLLKLLPKQYLKKRIQLQREIRKIKKMVSS